MLSFICFRRWRVADGGGDGYDRAMEGWRLLMGDSTGTPRLTGRPILCVSDIHGDLTALESVLAAVRHVKLAGIISCGDHLVGGPQPFEVWTRLASLGAHLTCGPSDLALASLDQLDGITPTSAEGQARLEMYLRTRRALGDVVCRRLGELPSTVVVSLDDLRGVMGLHGSPADDDGLLRDDADLDDRVASVAEDVLVTGANPVPFARRISQPCLMPLFEGGDDDEDGDLPLLPNHNLLVVNVGAVTPVPGMTEKGRTAHAVLVGGGDDGELHAWGADIVVGRARASRRAG